MLCCSNIEVDTHKSFLALLPAFPVLQLVFGAFFSDLVTLSSLVYKP